MIKINLLKHTGYLMHQRV